MIAQLQCFKITPTFTFSPTMMRHLYCDGPSDIQVALSAEIEPVAGESEDQMMFSRTLRP
jgi:hypothetical protein